MNTTATKTNTLRSIYFGILAALIALGGCSSPYEGPTDSLHIKASRDTFVVWRGFDHRWSHNHRWNRFGNWVQELDNCPGNQRCYGMVHAAASGTSGDVAEFNSYYSEVEAPGVGFTQVRDAVIVTDLLGINTSWTDIHSAVIPLQRLADDVADKLRSRKSYTAFINGWDIASQKGWSVAIPVDFSLEVLDARYAPDQDAIVVQWKTYLRMDCTSPECSTFEDEFSYKIVAHIGVMAYDDEVIASTTESAEHAYKWNAPRSALGNGSDKDAAELEPAPRTVAIDSKHPETARVLAWKSVSMRLYNQQSDTEGMDRHMIEWRSSIHDRGLENGQTEVEIDLLFKNWSTGMRDYQAFAYKDEGAATLQAKVVMLELPNARRRDGSWHGYHSWGGRGKNAEGTDAETHSWDAE